MIVFNLEKYVDFDMAATDCIMIAPAGMTKKAAKLIAAEAEDMFSKSDDVQGLIRYLKGWGCDTVKHYSIAIGGSL